MARVQRPGELIQTASAMTNLGSIVRPGQADAAQAPVTADDIGAAVYRASVDALDRSRLEIDGPGLARLVTRGQRENDRR